jgi:hypothetical protein
MLQPLTLLTVTRCPMRKAFLKVYNLTTQHHLEQDEELLSSPTPLVALLPLVLSFPFRSFRILLPSTPAMSSRRAVAFSVAPRPPLMHTIKPTACCLALGKVSYIATALTHTGTTVRRR